MREDAPGIAERVRRDGFALVAGLIDQAAVGTLVGAIEGADAQEAVRRRGGSTYAIRNLLSVVPEVRALMGHPALLPVVESVIGTGAFVTRAILFDKTPSANWKVGFQRRCVPVAPAERRLPCESPAGGALLMKPLLLHASGPATRPAHRRVIHLEYACGQLPGGLAWARA